MKIEIIKSKIINGVRKHWIRIQKSDGFFEDLIVDDEQLAMLGVEL